jgi:hypothetical protein
MYGSMAIGIGAVALMCTGRDTGQCRDKIVYGFQEAGNNDAMAGTGAAADGINKNKIAKIKSCFSAKQLFYFIRIGMQFPNFTDANFHS